MIFLRLQWQFAVGILRRSRHHQCHVRNSRLLLHCKCHHSAACTCCMLLLFWQYHWHSGIDYHYPVSLVSLCVPRPVRKFHRSRGTGLPSWCNRYQHTRSRRAPRSQSERRFPHTASHWQRAPRLGRRCKSRPVAPAVAGLYRLCLLDMCCLEPSMDCIAPGSQLMIKFPQGQWIYTN